MTLNVLFKKACTFKKMYIKKKTVLKKNVYLLKSCKDGTEFAYTFQLDVPNGNILVTFNFY